MPEATPPEELPDIKTRMAPYAEQLGSWYMRPRPIDMRYVDWNPPDRNEPLPPHRSEEHTSELQSLMRISYAVFCLKKKTLKTTSDDSHRHSAYRRGHSHTY